MRFRRNEAGVGADDTVTAASPPVLHEALLRSIAERGGIRRYPGQTVIITEGDSSDSLYIILSGRVKVYSGNEAGKELVIATHGPGEYIGELSLDGGVRSASVMTLEPSTVSVVTGATLRDFIAAHPDFAMNLIRKLIWRVRQATEGMKTLGLEDVHGRVVRLLLECSDPEGDHRVVRYRLSRLDIADRVGASREMVSRILKDLTAGGYISMESGRIAILKTLPPAA
jgi:CRP/FNR family cyclic AMP-dependent transcriptional regulator